MASVRAVALGLAVLCVFAATPAAAQGEEMRQPLSPGTVAPDFTAATLEGATIKLADWHGKVVVLNYFITWYRDAAQHLKMMEDLAGAFSAQGMRLVSISLDDGTRGLDEVRSLVRDQEIAHPIIADPQQRIAGLYGVRALPAIFIVGRDGVIAHYHEGYTEGDDERLGEVIAAVLQVGAPAAEPSETEAEAEPEAEAQPAAEEPEEPVCKCFRRCGIARKLVDALGLTPRPPLRPGEGEDTTLLR